MQLLTTPWARHGDTPAYSARPAAAKKPLPAVIVIQEVWGVDAHIRDLSDRFAAAGYYAVAPDLFAEDGERPSALSEERLEALKSFMDKAPPAVWRDTAARDEAVRALPAAEADAMRETMETVLTPNRPYGRWLATLVAVADAVRQESGCNGRVMSTGYCLGGHLSALLAGAYPQLAAAAIYYGPSPDVPAMSQLSCPLLGFYGSEDKRITDTVPAFADGLRAEGKQLEWHVYQGAPHAFFNDTRPSYHVDAARDAWARTLSLFAQQSG